MAEHSKSLQEQFELLQKQQKERLRHRQQREEKRTAEVKEDAPNETSIGKTWGMESGKDFDLDLHDVKGSHLTSEADLDDDAAEMEMTIRELRDENGRLYKLLGERDAENKMLQRRWSEEKKELIGNSFGSDNAATKIISLSKKTRELTAELEQERSKVKQLTKRLEDSTKPIAPLKDAAKDGKDDSTMENEVQMLQEKVKQSMNKLMEQKNQVETVKKELKLAQKVLSNEVGDGMSFQSLLNAPSSWRGRQQQIISLQNKVNELQVQLAKNKQQRQHQEQLLASSDGAYSSTSSASSLGGANPSFSNVNAVSASMSVHEAKHRSSLKRTENDRREAQERLKTELDSALLELDQLRSKHKAARARNDILAQDVKQWRDEARRLRDKAKADDELISASLRERESLKGELEKIRHKNASKMPRVQNGTPRIVHVSPGSDNNNTAGNNHAAVDELQMKVREQEAKVKALQDEIEVLQHRPMTPMHHGNHNGKLGHRPRSGDGEDSLVVELQQSKSLLQVFEVEREKLLELTQLHQKRLDEKTNKHLEMEKKCSDLRRNNANLEKRLERMEGNNGMAVKRGSRPTNQPRSTDSRSKPRTKSVTDRSEELETRLLIQADENDALKEALNSMLTSKQDDLKIYESMLDHSKKIFMEGLRKLNESSQDRCSLRDAEKPLGVGF